MCDNDGYSLFPRPVSDVLGTHSASTMMPGRFEDLAEDGSPPDGKPVRLKLWQIRSSTHCSVVGTCLSDRDLTNILKKCGLAFEEGTEPYQIHSYVVKAVCDEGPLARTVQKLLDRRHAGILRIFGRAKTGAELEQLWEREFAAGRIAGAYWAVQTYSHIPDDLFSKIFGEVHMLSHVLGRTVHAQAERASDLEAQIADLEARISRRREQHERSLCARQAEIEALKTALEKQKTVVQVQPQAAVKSAAKSSKRQYALVSARERARAAEARVEELERENAVLRSIASRQELRETRVSEPEVACPGAIACRLQIPAGEQLQVLYLGGRSGTVDRLRDIAQKASAQFLHHDGGKQEAFERITDLVARSHIVFCPVDCVSHRACLVAKDQCRKLQRTFVPLRSAGCTTFERALKQIEIVD